VILIEMGICNALLLPISPGLVAHRCAGPTNPKVRAQDVQPDIS
jgi:hypothetical protein